LAIQNRNANGRIKVIQPVKPALSRPRLPCLATAVLALHYVRCRHADRIEVKTADARNLTRLERTDRRGFSNS